VTLSMFHQLVPYTNKTLPLRTRYHLSPPFGWGHRSGLYQCETSALFYSRGSFHRLVCPLLTSISRLAHLAVCSVREAWTRNGSPGVNTMLSVRERRVYASGPIMDRGLKTVLRPGPSRTRLYSLAVRRPVLLRYSAVAELPPSGVCCQRPRCNNAMPFASIRLGKGLAFDRVNGAKSAPIRHRAVPGTQQFSAVDAGNVGGADTAMFLAAPLTKTNRAVKDRVRRNFG
jgi:hypothetical protein